MSKTVIIRVKVGHHDESISGGFGRGSGGMKESVSVQPPSFNN